MSRFLCDSKRFMNNSERPIHRSIYTACVPYKDTGYYLLHCFLTGKFALLTEKQKEVFECPSQHLTDKIIPSLLEYGFITKEDEYSLLIERLKKENPRIPQNKVLAVEICPTLNCNLDCRYCFEAGRRHVGSMNDETIDATAQFIKKRIKETNTNRLNIKWFGGEPTLEIETIKKLSDKLIAIANEYGIPYRAYIQTNGYLLTQDMVNILEDKKVQSIEITIDGNKDTHDKLRVLSGGQGTYERILDNLFHIKTNMRIYIRCNLHKDNINAFYDLMKDVDKLKAVTHNDIVCTPRVIRVKENLPKEGSFLKNSVLTNEEFLKHFHNLYSLNNFEKPSYHEFRYFTGKTSSPCKACNGTSFTIDELGNIYCCNMEAGNPDSVIGNVKTYENDASLINTNGYEFYRNSYCTNRERCKNCVILPICLGRCPKTWNEYYDCEWVKGNLPDTMIKVYDLLKKYNEKDNKD